MLLLEVSHTLSARLRFRSAMAYKNFTTALFFGRSRTRRLKVFRQFVPKLWQIEVNVRQIFGIQSVVDQIILDPLFLSSVQILDRHVNIKQF